MVLNLRSLDRFCLGGLFFDELLPAVLVDGCNTAHYHDCYYSANDLDH